MDNFHLKKISIMIKKENDTGSMENCDKMKNIKFEQEKEIIGTIEVLEENLKQEECINMEPRSLNESHDEKGYRNDKSEQMRTLNSNRCNSNTHGDSENVKNQHNNSDDTKNTPNSQKKRKLSLKIDIVESLNPQNDQCASNSDQSKESEDPLPKQIHYAPKRIKDKEKVPITLSKSSSQQIHQNGNKLFPKNKLEDIPKIRLETYRQNSSNSLHKGTNLWRICSPNTPAFKSPLPKNTPLTPKPSTSTLWQRQGSINYKILRGLDLMCWETLENKKLRTNEKYDVAYKNMIKKYPLIALFKCMGKKCSYATDDPVRMLNHLTVHDNDIKRRSEHIKKKYSIEMKSAVDRHEMNTLKNKESEDLNAIHDYFLCCSYCQLIEKDSKSLVHHINDIHRKDIYQCGFCFFRSCEKETCLAHWEKSHTNKLILIYECPGREKHQVAKNKVMERLIEKRKKNVVPLMCKGKFYKRVLN